ncbi:DUF4367 domain-containing protein [Anaerococcus provencensis]|uniref:DUF4367 domain-containing protein n=1 Tax=Anaerococcus provencensis TaxID=938293 RepID=UPI0003126680|nr:DUF4367 domain-containing protein [Anaerococcus provencensis]
MKNKRYLKLALILALATPLAACGNKANEEKPAQEASEEVKEAKEDGDLAVEPDPANEIDNKDSGEKGIYDLEFSYLPEGFGENFKDEKNDLRTVEYGAPKNPAQKITVQISNNEERMAGLVSVPEDAEDITIGENTGKYWDDGSFNYIFIKDGQNEIYTRSTLEKEEAVKVVEGIK